MRIAICDDDKVFIKKMFETVKTICDNKNIKCQIESFLDGLELIENYDQYHLIFLDIDMPMLNGIDVCKQIKKKKKNDIPYIVFVTNKDNMVFTIYIDWPLDYTDTGAKKIYRLTEHYRYDPSITYYNYANGYNPVLNVTQEMFDANKTGYYVEKDDADSFWGATCDKYRDETNEACFSFGLMLKVSQKDSNISLQNSKKF